MSRFDKILIHKAIIAMRPSLEHLNEFEKMEALGTLALMEAINLGCDKESAERMFAVMGERMVRSYDTFVLAKSLSTAATV